jgi:hypothetical protein
MAVMAAPNRCLIRARVAAVEPAEGTSRGALLLEVLEATALDGGLFVRAGDVVRAVLPDPGARLAERDELRAEAEYRGGPTGGVLRIRRLLSSPSEPQAP